MKVGCNFEEASSLERISETGIYSGFTKTSCKSFSQQMKNRDYVKIHCSSQKRLRERKRKKQDKTKE